MIPVITPERVAELDAAASVPIDELIDRAARAVALAARDMLGGTYGRRVTVVVGPGNNGADGRVAAGHLRRLGVRCALVAAADAPPALAPTDLVIDAAFGTGLRRAYDAPTVAPATPVLAVDIPSGIDGLTGVPLGRPLAADRTVTFVALKPGLVLEPGRTFAGDVRVVDIGLDPGPTDVHVITDVDVARQLMPRPVDDHKWRSGVRIIGGSPGMTGAAALAARAAQRSGAGIVQLATRGGRGDEGPVEAVGHPLPLDGWGRAAVDGLLPRVRALLVGPGLGPVSAADLAEVVGIDRPLVIDGDALLPDVVTTLADRSAPTVLTPHDGEWARIGGAPDDDRIAATAAFATRHQVTVLRKGPTSLVAAPDGAVAVVTSGSPALASAGTGDVLAGCVVALLARGLDGPAAAMAAAHLHGRAGSELGEGLVAWEVADRLPAVIAAVRDSAS